jgi:hypothetical protein
VYVQYYYFLSLCVWKNIQLTDDDDNLIYLLCCLSIHQYSDAILQAREPLILSFKAHVYLELWYIKQCATYVLYHRHHNYTYIGYFFQRKHIGFLLYITFGVQCTYNIKQSQAKGREYTKCTYIERNIHMCNIQQ